MRDDAPAGAGFPAGAASVDAAAQTAYLPPVRGNAPGPDGAGAPHPLGVAGAGYPAGAPADPAAQTAYLPPVRDDASAGAGFPTGAPADAAAQTAYLPPVRDDAFAGAGFPAGAASADAAAQTAYLPPVRDDASAGAGFPTGAPADAAAQTAYLPPVRDDAPAPAEPHAEPSAAGAGYSEPTLGGSTRVIDPAQARAEGRSPIIDPGPQPALVTTGLGVLLAGAAAVGEFALLVPLVLLQGLTAAGWFRLNGMWPARQGIALAFAGAVTADIAVLAVDDAYGPGAVVGTLGAWVLLTLVLQLRSHADPDERMYGLMASVASAALAIVCAGYLAADLAAVTVGAVAVAVATFARALPLPPAPSVGVALAAAAGAGVAVGGLTDVGAAGGALLGLVAGVCALIGLRVAAYDYPSKFVHMTAGVALPLAVAAPAVYLIGRVVG
ncbi:hypothetical protein [Streptomyces antimicrobicus]|uniref:hypothetical protein n=1 Tax=Streptomyces antimicrobicus TaxID=2883108 RepID=UPI0040400DFF